MRTKREKVIRPVSSQLGDFLRLVPAPASSDEFCCSDVTEGLLGMEKDPMKRSGFSRDRFAIVFARPD
jgi:hypothetical protein